MSSPWPSSLSKSCQSSSSPFLKYKHTHWSSSSAFYMVYAKVQIGHTDIISGLICLQGSNHYKKRQCAMRLTPVGGEEIVSLLLTSGLMVNEFFSSGLKIEFGLNLIFCFWIQIFVLSFVFSLFCILGPNNSMRREPKLRWYK